MTRIITALASLVLIIVAAGIKLDAAEAKRIVTDIHGRKIAISTDSKRIIAIGPGSLRLVCYLGAQDRLVGIEKFEISQKTGRPYRYANPDLLILPEIGPGGPKSINSEPDLEAVLKIRPDIIFASYMKPDMADRLQAKLNIPVITLSYGHRLATIDPLIFKSLDIMANILNKQKRAQNIKNKFNYYLNDLKKRTERIDDKSKPIVYAAGVGYRGARGFTSTDSVFLPFEWIGARNAAFSNKVEDHLFIDEERILMWNPDCVFIDGAALNLIEIDYKKKNSYYQSLKAFKNNRVFILYPFNSYTTNIETAILDAYAAGKILFPERFGDVNIKKKSREILKFFSGKDVYKNMHSDFGGIGENPEFLTKGKK